MTLYSDVEDLKWTQQGAEIRLYWNVPTNCIGATVIRIDNNEKTQVCVSDSANGNCVDKGLAYDRKYTYRVIAKYADNGKSDGKEIHDVYIMPIVDSFTINASPAKDGSYKVTWSIKQRGINLRVLLDNRIEMNAKSEDGFVLLKLPKETFAVVDVEAQSGNGWKRSEHSITVNTYSPCEIDKKASKLEETVQLGLRNSRHYVSIQIVISEPIPQSVIGFYYFVRDSEYKRISTRESVKTSEEIRGLISKYDSTFRQAEIVQWARSEEIGSASDCQRISLDAYRERNGILYQSLANEQTAYYVSVFAIHKKAGKEVVSEPCKYRITRPLNVDILWSVKVTRKEVKLMVELLGNRPVDYLPNLLLTLRETQRSGQRFMGNNERVIMKVGGDEFETPAKRKAVVFEEPIYIDYKEVRNGIFDLQIDEDTGKDKFTTRWKEGFTGKA